MYKIVLPLLISGIITITYADSATQTDWSGGSEVLGPVIDWGDQFYQSSCIWSGYPGIALLMHDVLEHIVDGEFDCAFFPNNAASSSENKSYLKKLKRPASLVRMFKDYGSHKRDALNIPNRYTTNPQAEVLVFGDIPTKYFMNI